MRTMSLAFCGAALVAVMMTGCEGGTPAKPSPSNPAGEAKTEVKQELQYSGREGFQKMYQAARMWSPDARPYKLQSQLTQDATGQGGKAAVWRAGFASAGKRNIKAFVWSGTHSGDAPSFGVSSGTEDTYNPSNSSTQVFDLGFVKQDSDKAYEIAQEHGGQKLLKQDPKQPVFYILDWDPRENVLLWHVIYGTDRESAKLRIAVNASTGAYVRTEH